MEQQQCNLSTIPAYSIHTRPPAHPQAGRQHTEGVFSWLQPWLHFMGPCMQWASGAHAGAAFHGPMHALSLMGAHEPQGPPSL